MLQRTHQHINHLPDSFSRVDTVTTTRLLLLAGSRRTWTLPVAVAAAALLLLRPVAAGWPLMLTALRPMLATLLLLSTHKCLHEPAHQSCHWVLPQHDVMQGVIMCLQGVTGLPQPVCQRNHVHGFLGLLVRLLGRVPQPQLTARQLRQLGQKGANWFAGIGLLQCGLWNDKRRAGS